jgi:hypothetical protein
MIWAQQESELLWYPDAFRDNVSAELGVPPSGHNKRVNSCGTQMPSETMYICLFGVSTDNTQEKK